MMIWLKKTANEEVEFNTSPLVSVHSSPPITVSRRMQLTHHHHHHHQKNPLSMTWRRLPKRWGGGMDLSIPTPAEIPVPLHAESEKAKAENQKPTLKK